MIVKDLNELTDPVDHSAEAGHKDVAKRLQTVLDSVGGLGLSANQIGVQDSRTCLVSVSQDIFFINPRIVNRKGSTELEEGCLSIPNVQVKTERNDHVQVRNANGEEFDVKWKYAKKHEDWTVLEINEKQNAS